MSNTPYFTMKKTDNSADIYIFGDIVPWKWDDSDTTSYDLATQIKALPEDAAITIHINSNGGDLKEGLGIYNVLKGRNVTTICEGFAASSASVIFCAGSKRVMNAASLLFIHNASMLAAGTADDFEKAADDLRIITDAAKAAYREAGVNVSDVELDRMMDEETWITPADAVNWGFATEIAEADQNGVRNDAMQAIMRAVVPQDERKEDEAAVSMRELVDRLTAAVSALESHTITNTADPENEAEAEAPAADPEEEATTPTPAPAQVENKGFFGFSKN